jgi:hypothetical protein
MADTIVDFSKGPKRIALVVRGKLGPTHHPDKLDQHADTIEQDGSPVGFFGTGNNGSFNGIGMGMDGIVYDYPLFQRYRPQYVDQAMAISRRVVSTVLIIEVDKATADKFDDAWSKMKSSPGGFDILGNNCATHASKAFIAAGVLDSTIPWMDTPDNLYDQLVDKVPAGKRTSYTGYVGFTPRVSGGYDLVIKPYTYTPTIAQPNQGSFGGSSGA